MSLARLLARPDFRRNPLRAVARRVHWRVRWQFNKQPWQLDLGENLKILAPKGGAGALNYYAGYSEPETSNFLLRFLREGMTFWDVGAHIGEYSLLAARQIGATGVVQAFEPHPVTGDLLLRSAQQNGISNVNLHRTAVSERSGTRNFTTETEASISHLDDDGVLAVATTTLDQFLKVEMRTPHLIKVDVEGAELAVLEGSAGLLSHSESTAPTWIIEYAPENCLRFGYSAEELLTTFRLSGYRTRSG